MSTSRILYTLSITSTLPPERRTAANARLDKLFGEVWYVSDKSWGVTEPPVRLFWSTLISGSTYHLRTLYDQQYIHAAIIKYLHPLLLMLGEDLDASFTDELSRVDPSMSHPDHGGVGMRLG